jgi:putative FmdB family regulatory protein
MVTTSGTASEGIEGAIDRPWHSYTDSAMPIYEYRCDNGHSFEVLQRMTDDPVAVCETCDAPVQRVFHPIAVHFKGKGFYNTDYGTKKRQREKAAEGKSEGGSEKSGGTDKSDGKSGGDSSGGAKSGGDSSGGAKSGGDSSGGGKSGGEKSSASASSGGKSSD